MVANWEYRNEIDFYVVGHIWAKGVKKVNPSRAYELRKCREMEDGGWRMEGDMKWEVWWG